METLDKTAQIIHFMQVMSLLITGALGGITVLLFLQLCWGYWKKEKIENDKYTGI
jgi:hypothetical protein